MEHQPVNHGGDIRVNMAGVPVADARKKVTATLSLLSEGTHHCDGCGKEIPGLAVYFTRPRPEHGDGWELVALTCPECGGYGEGTA